jgi:carbon monoxide dehydrogenase subunit G
MDIEKSIELSATPEQLWTLLLDPLIMAGCVPGMQSIDVISETEYLVALKVKISFVTASFKIRTNITKNFKNHKSMVRIQYIGMFIPVIDASKQNPIVFIIIFWQRIAANI